MSNGTAITGFEQIYQEMFAGKIANHDDDVYQSIVYIATDILKTDKIHVGVFISEGSAYYFAAPSIVFASVLDFKTALVAAAPGHPAHKGEGAYVINQGKIAVAAIYINNTLSLICNDSERVMEKLADMELPIHYPDDNHSPLLIESTRGRFRRLGDKFSRKTIKISAIVTAISFTIATLASFAETAFSTSLTNVNEKNAEELNTLVGKLEYSSPLSQQVGQLNKLSATVVRGGGWIDEYTLKGDKEAFVVSLPEWVTQDYILALGKGAVAENDKVNNIIKVTKK